MSINANLLSRLCLGAATPVDAESGHSGFLGHDAAGNFSKLGNLKQIILANSGTYCLFLLEYMYYYYYVYN